METRSRESAWSYAALAGLVGLYLVRAWPSATTLVDDAWISARYAAHAAEGHGFVYNVGEPVEGFTNLLWTAWLAFGLLFGAPVETWMIASGLLFGAAAIVFAERATLALAPDRPWWALAAAGVLALDVHHAVSSTNGLETSMFVATLLLALWRTQVGAGPVALGALAALPLIRPEGLVFAPLLALAAPTGRRRLLTAVVGSLLAVTTWRLWTYGAWLPNTFAAKANGRWSRHLSTNLAYLGRDGFLWVGPVVGLLAGVADLRRHPARGLVLLGVAASVLAALRVDLWMPAARLFVPSVALVGCLAFAARGRLLQGAWVVCAVVGVFTGHEGAVRAYDRAHSVTLPNGVATAVDHIRPHLPAGSVVTTRDAGLLAYRVGTAHRVAETHHRALTQLHPGRRDADVLAYSPQNPALLVLTVAKADERGFRYGPDRRLFQRTTLPYRYLGRVRQHHRRHVDLYVRGDLAVPPLPEDIVVNRTGPRPPDPTRNRPRRRGRDRKR